MTVAESHRELLNCFVASLGEWGSGECDLGTLLIKGRDRASACRTSGALGEMESPQPLLECWGVVLGWKRAGERLDWQFLCVEMCPWLQLWDSAHCPVGMGMWARGGGNGDEGST